MAGEKRPTISDVARAAGVSIAVVSYALNGRPGVAQSTRARVLRVADEIGWRPSVTARSLSRSRPVAVGLTLTWRTGEGVVDRTPLDFVAGLQTTLAERGIATLIQLAGDQDCAITTYRQWWAERRVDAVVVTDVLTDDPRLAALSDLRVPAVAVCHPDAAPSVPTVWHDDAAAATATADYLLTLGHRRIGHVSGPRELHATLRRSAALTTAAAAAGAVVTVEDTDSSPMQAAAATRRLLSADERPTALVFDNALTAMAGLEVARRLGLDVPWEVSIVAGEDSPMCQLAMPSLTALCRDSLAEGAAAGRLLLDVLDRPQRADAIQSPTAGLVVRGSTAPPVD